MGVCVVGGMHGGGTCGAGEVATQRTIRVLLEFILVCKFVNFNGTYFISFTSDSALNKLVYSLLSYSSDGIFLATGGAEGSVAVYTSFNLCVSYWFVFITQWKKKYFLRIMVFF